jgi:DNA-binding transcriptional ArsR family regulator
MSISAALFSEGQSRVYRWVFGQPAREFHLSELRWLTGLGSASLQRELNALADAGLVLSERVGNLSASAPIRKAPCSTSWSR